MNKKSRLLACFVVFAMVGLVCMARAAPETATASLVWIAPSKPPEFRNTLEDAQFQFRFDEEAKNLDIAALEASTMPITGRQVTYVVPDGDGERLGIRDGEVITQIDEQKFQGVPNEWQPADHPRKMHLTSVDGKERVLTIPPGRMGVYAQKYFRPDLWYIRGKQRSPKWDKDVLVGIAVRNSDPDLAETAWRHAIGSGYPADDLSNYCGTYIAWRQNRSSDALAFAHFTPTTNSDAGQLIAAQDLYIFALSGGFLDVAQQVMHERESEFSKPSLEGIDTLVREKAAKPTPTAMPSEVAKSMHRASLLRRVSGLFAWRDILGGQAFRFDAGTDYVAKLDMKTVDGVENLDYRVRFRARCDRPSTGSFSHFFYIGLYGHAPHAPPPRGPQPEMELITTLGIEANAESPIVQMIQCGGETRSYRFDSTIALDGIAVHELRIIRVGGQVETFLDGTRQAYMPFLDRVKTVALYMQTTGMEVDVVGLSGGIDRKMKPGISNEMPIERQYGVRRTFIRSFAVLRFRCFGMRQMLGVANAVAVDNVWYITTGNQIAQPTSRRIIAFSIQSYRIPAVCEAIGGIGFRHLVKD